MVELLPEPGSESRFRISPEPGATAWWREISWLPDHLVVHRFSLLSFQPGGASTLSPSSLVVHAGDA